MYYSCLGEADDVGIKGQLSGAAEEAQVTKARSSWKLGVCSAELSGAVLEAGGGEAAHAQTAGP